MSKELTKAQVEKAAHKLEALADDKNVDALSHQLHDLKPKDRLAIMNKIKEDEQQPNSTLPQLDFYQSGELKSMDVKSAGKTTEHVEFDKDSANRTVMTTHNDVADSQNIYDTVTGQLTLETINFKDGTNLVAQHSRDTGKIMVEDTEYPHGRMHRHLEYDKNGDLTEAEYRHSDRSISHYEYQKHDKVEQLETDKNGNRVETFWDPDTRKIVARSVENKDGSGDFRKFDPKTGWIISIDQKAVDGTLTHWNR